MDLSKVLGLLCTALDILGNSLVKTHDDPWKSLGALGKVLEFLGKTLDEPWKSFGALV